MLNYSCCSTDDQIDIVYSVEEETTGSVGGNIGYSDFGLMLGFNLQEQNFLVPEIQLVLVLIKIFTVRDNLSFMNPYATKWSKSWIQYLF